MRLVDADVIDKQIGAWIGHPGYGDYYTGYDNALCAIRDLIADMPTITPVSYTHLDVYKRQVQKVLGGGTVKEVLCGGTVQKQTGGMVIYEDGRISVCDKSFYRLITPEEMK